MRYWWVNQNQTFRQETGGGCLWSPKRSQGNRFNQFCENMREVAPADLVFSFSDTFIRAIGVVQGHCYECPKPPEFGETGGRGKSRAISSITENVRLNQELWQLAEDFSRN